MKYEISKRCSYILKGIAVLLMFYHHFCGFPEWIAEGLVCKNIIPFSVQGISLMRIIAVFGSICVEIFTFLSGYYCWIHWDGFKDRMRRVRKLLLNYWIIFIIYILIGILFGEPFPSIDIFIYNLFGFAAIPNDQYLCVSFGWYIGFYIVMIILLPPVHKWLDKIKHDELIVFFWGGIILLFLKVGVGIWPIDLIFSDFASRGELFSIGYFVAKYDILTKVGSVIKSSYKRVLLSFTTLVLVFGIKCIVGSHLGELNMYILYTPPFLIALFYIVDFLESSENWLIKGMMNLLEILGKNSMNLWLLHGIFFTPKASLQFIAYWPQYGILITIWSFVFLLPISMFIGKIQKRFARVEKLSTARQ